MNALPIGKITFNQSFDMERLKRLQRREYLAYSIIRMALQEWDREDFDTSMWDEMAKSYMDRVEKDE